MNFGRRASYNFPLGSNTPPLEKKNRSPSETKVIKRIKVETKTRTHPVNVRKPLWARACLNNTFLLV